MLVCIAALSGLGSWTLVNCLVCVVGCAIWIVVLWVFGLCCLGLLFCGCFGLGCLGWLRLWLVA